jgi:peptide-methionine (S)-S-oxide reductase
MTDTERATLAGGCFWCIEAPMEELDGVHGVTSGYAGGHTENPTYREVCSGNTGHAEVVQVTYDPERIAYEDLLDVFFTVHDPTQLNRQGPDVGTQYRSAIFVHDDTQRQAAEASRAAWQSRVRAPIATEIQPAASFWPAEDYHQQYLEKRGLATCTIG